MDGRNRAGDTTHRCAGGHEHNHAIDLGHRWGLQKTTFLRARSTVNLRTLGGTELTPRYDLRTVGQ